MKAPARMPKTVLVLPAMRFASQACLVPLPAETAGYRSSMRPDTEVLPGKSGDRQDPSRLSVEMRAEQEARYQEACAAGHSEGYSVGFKQGQQEGLDAAHQATEAQRASWAQRLQVLQQLLDAIPGEIAALHTIAEEDLVALAFELVCRIAGQQAATCEGMRAMVKTALAQLHPGRSGATPLTVHVAPEDLACLQAESSWPGGPPGHVRWLADSAVQGGCRIESRQGMLDARLDALLDGVRQHLLSIYQARRSGQECRSCPA